MRRRSRDEPPQRPTGTAATPPPTHRPRALTAHSALHPDGPGDRTRRSRCTDAEITRRVVRHARLARPRLAGSAGRGSLGIRKFLGKRKSSQVHQVAIYTRLDDEHSRAIGPDRFLPARSCLVTLNRGDPRFLLAGPAAEALLWRLRRLIDEPGNLSFTTVVPHAGK